MSVEQQQDKSVHEQTLLKIVGGNQSREDSAKAVKTNSRAVLTVLNKHELVELRAVGASAVHNMVKACASAQAQLDHKYGPGKKTLSGFFVF